MENGGQDKENRSNPEPVAGERRAEVVKVPVEFAIEEVKSYAIESEKTWAGIKFCYIIIGLIGLESVIMILYFVFATYSLKSLVQPLTTESVDIFKEARAAIVDDILRISNVSGQRPVADTNAASGLHIRRSLEKTGFRGGRRLAYA